MCTFRESKELVRAYVAKCQVPFASCRLAGTLIALYELGLLIA